ncbi:peptide deformylase [Clostridium sp. MT-14]|jgi:peptide deformylase|uniref:Peptide deformylase n=1 Tax=Clostridium aromativorans TaxID=2836848 RepID=A0ABS8N5Z8_9CLOT|nr:MULTISPECIES: peptide deformylase [Clostridium]KAA8680123.1 peptide deformylase [Clostridium sp. HV4-5-A1G]MCC9294584.1 peptide deformylase [Clostridium aromativorans]CAB1243958.1 Peptide deformylase [Clostridiaceae bacterium BL-3]
MDIKKILLLGNENLYKICKEVSKDELDRAEQIVKELHDTMMNFRKKYGFGRAIAAPQINELFRIIYVDFNYNSIALINPKVEFVDDEKFEVWDDCMSFPGIEVRLYRHKRCKVHYKDLEWNDCTMEPEGDLSELIQHEYDHLDGILAFQRAIDKKSFRMNKDKMGYLDEGLSGMK